MDLLRASVDMSGMSIGRTPSSNTRASRDCVDGKQLFFDRLFGSGRRTSFVTEAKAGAGQTVRPGTWLSEASLWMRWRHKGTAVCGKDCFVLTVNAEKFQKF